jgi:hypothetical protein
MKLLQNALLESLSSAISTQGDNIAITGSLDSYSCKMTGNDKKLYKYLNTTQGHSPNEMKALSPSESQQQLIYGFSPNSMYSSRNQMECAEVDSSEFVSVISGKMLFTLLSTLNAAFPDYDFSQAKSEEFSREPSLAFVVNNVDTNLSTSLGEQFVELSPRLWKAIDDEISLQECEIYSYNPDMETDPFGEEGCLWSFNYLFYNKELKRIVFFKCHGSSIQASVDDDFNDSQSSQFQMDVMG